MLTAKIEITPSQNKVEYVLAGVLSWTYRNSSKMYTRAPIAASVGVTVHETELSLRLFLQFVGAVDLMYDPFKERPNVPISITYEANEGSALKIMKGGTEVVVRYNKGPNLVVLEPSPTLNLTAGETEIYLVALREWIEHVLRIPYII